MLYFIFTVDGDWKGYFDVNLPLEKRRPDPKAIGDLIRREIEVAGRRVGGRFVHFVHTSPCARTFFLKEPFIKLWRLIAAQGGDIGIHCHEEEPYDEYYFEDIPRMKAVLSEQAAILRNCGLEVCAYRGGFLAFNHTLIPALEENGLYFDFSCEPDRYLVCGKKIVSDWRDSPRSLYKMSYKDHRRRGNSSVYEVPIGLSGRNFLYFEKSDAGMIERAGIGLKKEAGRRDIVVSVLTHTYEYAAADAVREIEDKLSILCRFGRFINIKGLKGIIKRNPLWKSGRR